jgi:hypothetical protein
VTGDMDGLYGNGLRRAEYEKAWRNKKLTYLER